MTAPDENPRPSRGGLKWTRGGRAVVWLRFLIVPTWIEAEAGELGNLLPHSSEALEVERDAFEEFGLPLLSRTMGADYNVFLISRIWREANRQELGPPIHTAGVRADRPITIAGDPAGPRPGRDLRARAPGHGIASLNE